ncbi:hypothetical protein [uncultured Thiodictyon sp.]|uniref:hypothetical protein n=1 Tax=uncultured Thiodictyon sp. TaxID=1846217 RepID=UPI0025FB963B|nr:hypothetical protein [uncultured Thiodictyon sp.]
MPGHPPAAGWFSAAPIISCKNFVIGHENFPTNGNKVFVSHENRSMTCDKVSVNAKNLSMTSDKVFLNDEHVTHDL